MAVNLSAFVRGARLSFLFSLFNMYGFTKSAINAPAINQTPPNDSSRKAKFFLPSRDGERLTGKFKNYVTFSISGLFFSGGPSAVVFAIRAVIVYAFKRVFISRLFPHVEVKGSKVIPTFVYENSASTVPVKKWTVGIVTPLSHGFPYEIFRDFFGKTMLKCVRHNTTETPTTRGGASQHVTFAVCLAAPARALALHVSAPFLSKGRTCCGEHSENFSGVISHGVDHIIRRVSFQ